MGSDPAIEEIRAVRREISADFGHDTRALVRHYQELQKRHKDRFVRDRVPVYPEALSSERIGET